LCCEASISCACCHEAMAPPPLQPPGRRARGYMRLMHGTACGSAAAVAATAATSAIQGFLTQRAPSAAPTTTPSVCDGTTTALRRSDSALGSTQNCAGMATGATFLRKATCAATSVAVLVVASATVRNGRCNAQKQRRGVMMCASAGPLDSVKESLQSLADDALAGPKQVAQQVQVSANDLAQSAKQFAEDVKAAPGRAATAAEETTENVEKRLQNLKALPAEVGGKLATPFIKAAAVPGQVANSASTFASSAQLGFSGLAGLVTSTADSIKAGAVNISNLPAGLKSRLVDEPLAVATVVSQIPEKVQGGVDVFVNKVEGTADAVQATAAAIGNFPTAVVTSVQLTTTNIIALPGRLANSVTGTFDGFVKTAKVDKTVNTVTSLPGQAAEGTVNAMTNFPGKVTQVTSAASEVQAATAEEPTAVTPKTSTAVAAENAKPVATEKPSDAKENMPNVSAKE